jgi:phosphohistidine phosphatase SixA
MTDGELRDHALVRRDFAAGLPRGRFSGGLAHRSAADPAPSRGYAHRRQQSNSLRQLSTTAVANVNIHRSARRHQVISAMRLASLRSRLGRSRELRQETNAMRLTAPGRGRAAPTPHDRCRQVLTMLAVVTARVTGASALVAIALALGASGSAVTPARAADTLPLAELARPGRVLMLRHASAPGTGDPPNFKLGDCSTQRNLDAGGRAQATELGTRLARAGIGRAKVYSSQWCRCLETARLLKLGTPAELPALNSFFGRPEDRQPNVAALRSFLAGLPVDGLPVILVTHQVTISAITGEGAVSGGGHLLELNGSGSPRVLGRIEAN